MDNVKQLLSKVTKTTEALKTAQFLYKHQLSPDFSIFDYINSSENGLSRIIADLLNPMGTHAQGESFLKLFMQYCSPNVTWQPFVNNLKKTQVTTEESCYKLSSKRRMDIYLSQQSNDKSYGICIENKPYASDGFEQLTDYAKELENRHGKGAWHLVYLSDAENPSDHSVTEKLRTTWVDNQQFTHLNYADLLPWLKACISECQNASVSEFLNQFIKFLQRQFMGIRDMSEEQLILDQMIESDANIEASIKISQNLYELKKTLIYKLVDDLKNFSSDKNYSVMLETSLEGYKYEKIIFKSNNNLSACLEFEASSYNSPALGIFKHDENFNTGDAQFDKVKLKFEESFNSVKTYSGKMWAGWYRFEPRDWWHSSEPWIMIKNGDMANKIIQEVDKIFEVINSI